MLKLTGVGKLFGSRVVLRNVSLETQPGTVSLLVGANGAGKTTLLKIMAGLARPSAGTVERHCDPGELGYLGHATFIYPGLSALENLAFWSRLHRLGADRSRVMAQRLNLARILLQSPRILLLDEPGTGLDGRSLNLLHREIAQARTDGASVVWISHDLNGDAAHADRILAIANRTLAYDGPPEDWPGLEALEAAGKTTRRSGATGPMGARAC